MVIRIDTSCPRCSKPNSVFGHDLICHECSVRSFMKSNLKVKRREQSIREELNAMKPEVKQRMHEEILAELLEEEKERDRE